MGKGATMQGEHASLWVGQQHSWDTLRKAAAAGVPLALGCAVLYCGNKAQAAEVLAHEDAAASVLKLKQLAGTALPAYKGGDKALAGAIYEWICSASCVPSRGFVGQVAEVCVWRRGLSKNDVAFVSACALLGNEQGVCVYIYNQLSLSLSLSIYIYIYILPL